MDMLDPRDAILYAACPLVPAPTLGVFSPLCAPGKRLVAARDGLYVEARSLALHFCVRVADVPMPYGTVEPFVRLLRGPIPREVLDTIRTLSLGASPTEVAFAVLAGDAGYRMVELDPLSASASHVRYAEVDCPERLVLDVHSHGEHGAYFSGTDDASDLSRQGPYIAGVIAPREQPGCTRTVWRAVCPPYLVDLDLELMRGVFA